MASQTLCIDEFNFNEDYENVKFFFVNTTDCYRPGNPYKLFSVPGLSRVKMEFSLPHGISEPQCIQLTVTDGSWSGMVDVYFNDRLKVEGLEMDFHDNFKNRKIPLQLDELDCDEILRPNKNNITIKLREDAAMVYWLSDAKIELLYNAASDEEALQLQDDAKRLRGRERKKEEQASQLQDDAKKLGGQKINVQDHADIEDRTLFVCKLVEISTDEDDADIEDRLHRYKGNLSMIIRINDKVAERYKEMG